MAAPALLKGLLPPHLHSVVLARGRRASAPGETSCSPCPWVAASVLAVSHVNAVCLDSVLSPLLMTTALTTASAWQDSAPSSLGLSVWTPGFLGSAALLVHRALRGFSCSTLVWAGEALRTRTLELQSLALCSVSVEPNDPDSLCVFHLLFVVSVVQPVKWE